ncbi:uncharacterized protein GGS25DRAFT_96724 [Hypoxylon fragiforme]|uniref:uncharacterized protein n=1 Tax=Hypoxylon fragiforme TaxID=63214 RepID=UPI0020C70D7C|nr:uncharacterized protein GGS25DRAFT_96724 [Hypoxylon fragiforme]KAI2603516.1 hypothetical protein GGS25DRAFT_96724 [Hypoxylon fragiforme]
MAPDMFTLAKRVQLIEKAGDIETISDFNASPLFTESVRYHASLNETASQPFSAQYGLLGGNITDDAAKMKLNDLIYYNVAAPSSTFICGSQGSGKSHTLSCLLENCLIKSVANELPRPLTGIVFHYDTFISDAGGSPCEAAFLSTDPKMKVRVLCAPTNITSIKKTYSNFPNIKVEELRINEADLNTKRMMDLMAIKTDGDMPLYMHVVTRVLRDLRREQQSADSGFSYRDFLTRIMSEELTDSQKTPLMQRLDTLTSFMAKEKVTMAADNFNLHISRSTGNNWAPTPRQLTIVDLSCPCVTAETACSLFNICLSLFLEQNPDKVGRVVALDEAHKYMNASAEASALTEQLLATIRLQRHLGVRVIISTQEPTVSPKLLDLCSVTIVHRFTSPDWLHTLQRHLAGVSITRRMKEKMGSNGLGNGNGNSNGNGNGNGNGVASLGSRFQTLSLEDSDPTLAMFMQIVKLRVGEALLFSPSAVIAVDEKCSAIEKLNNGVLKIKIRKRVTEDGGKSIMAG